MDPSTGVQAAAPWWAAYPEPKEQVSAVTRHTVLQWMKDGKQAGKDFILVDLRLNDHKGGSIRGSINLPAGSLYPTIPTLHALFSAAGVKTVIWFCNTSKGRGTRAARWMADYLKEKEDDSMQSCILEDGIVGWATAGEEFSQMMDGYDVSAWST